MVNKILKYNVNGITRISKIVYLCIGTSTLYTLCIIFRFFKNRVIYNNLSLKLYKYSIGDHGGNTVNFTHNLDDVMSFPGIPPSKEISFQVIVTEVDRYPTNITIYVSLVGNQPTNVTIYVSLIGNHPTYVTIYVSLVGNHPTNVTIYGNYGNVT